MGYLDKKGLTYLWGKLKSAFIGKWGDVVRGEYTFRRSASNPDQIIINGEFAEDGSIYFNAGGSTRLSICVDQNIQGGIYLTAGLPSNGDTPGVLSNLGSPIQPLDAANKQYVDSSIAAAITRAIEEAY